VTPVRRAVPGDLTNLLPLVAEFCAIDGHEHDADRVRTALGPLFSIGSAAFSPKDNTVRILKSASPNDTAPGWKLAIVPTSTSFTVKRTVNTDAGKYFQGDLISTRGGKIGRNLFILAQELGLQGKLTAQGMLPLQRFHGADLPTYL
jgi:hypothetical protein